ncbi:hypothetical protein DVA67_012580 [Solirubrobacter sp. CPCC 204708]|uniref:CSLREA domain-containing protein n=1 Tax=Solirubrobacter deserti TaxID=2282478 RepID=A0ABT4RK90_9ACTN|nr:choice-of-anchor Q domain-containing protein [Solirubrobacter deserti]MBE2316811.1 hypothetical protein [Solirubrobacter deserti]MDA0138972.1 hypothetical protein [Solirubrobacter deserti]
MRRLAIAAFGALAFSAAPAHAATFQVTTPQDLQTPCTPSECSLRAAVSAALANGAGEDDVVNVPAGEYAVSGGLNLNGTPAVRITIAGAGANATIIRPTGATRVLTVGAGASIAVQDVTLRDGVASDTGGGNVRVENTGSLRLLRTRVTNGSAPQGGGILAGGNQLSIVASLIDGNRTVGTGQANGGGIYASGNTTTLQLSVQDSTITDNEAVNGGGLYVTSNVATALRGVTLARNRARAFGNAGGIFANGSGGVRFEGSIIAGNTMPAASTATPVPSNCGISPPPVDEGGNLDSGTNCGVAGHTNTDPKLAAALDTSAPPVLAIAADSPARDIAPCGTRTFDQRGVLRPQGLACDAGAYEYAEPVVEPPPDPTPTATPPPGPTATPTPTVTPVPTPVVNRTIVVGPTRGTVKVKLPGANRYLDLDATRGIPVGSTVDTRKGRVTLTSIPRPGAPPETAVFYDGLFRVTQSRGITNLTLTEPLARCPRNARASAAAAKAKKRRLWGDGKGAFRTSGKYSAATVRGTKWLVEDSCAGTLTRVTQGSVRVRDNVRKRTIVVRPGKPYTARPRP